MTNAFADKLAKAVADAGNDCAKLGTNLKGLNEDAKKLATSQKEFEKNAENQKAFKDKYQTELDKKMKDPMEKLGKCMENADVKTFIDTLSAD
jgi:hypothetical protein